MELRIRRLNGIALVMLIVGALAVGSALRGQDPQPAGGGQPGAAPAENVEPAVTPDEKLDGDDDAGGEVKAGSEAAADDNSGSILKMIVDSGATGMVFMGILGLFSIVAGTVAVERAVNMRRGRIIPHEFGDEVEACSRRGQADPTKLADLCSRCDAPSATILHAALLRHGRSLIEVEKAMEDAAAREMSELRSKIRPLNTIGSIAPLVGLLGTVVGMIIAFHTASQAGLGKAELLAKGIYMALLTTAGGLSVAIPSLLLSSYFSGRIDRFFREIDRRLMPMLPLLANTQLTPTLTAPAPLSRKAASPLMTSKPAKEAAPPPEPKAAEPKLIEPEPEPEPKPEPASRPPATRSSSPNPLMGDRVRPR